MARWMDGEREVDGQEDGQMNRQTDWQIDLKVAFPQNKWIPERQVETGRQANGQTGRLANRQAGRQED